VRTRRLRRGQAGFIDDDAAVLQRVTPFSGGDRGVDRTDARSVRDARPLHGKSEDTYERSSATVDKSLRHNIVQAALFKHLEGIHGRENTSGEQSTGIGTSVDVAILEGESYTYYELKTGLSAQSCIREAIGQLMEYSFWPGSRRADKLVVVGEPSYDAEAKAYVKKLRKEFSLPIEYQQFDMKSGRLK